MIISRYFRARNRRGMDRVCVGSLFLQHIFYVCIKGFYYFFYTSHINSLKVLQSTSKLQFGLVS
jgi:hypothetical protein